MYFPNVNFLRAFAALLVLVYHVIELAPWPFFPTEGLPLTFRVGWIGVDLRRLFLGALVLVAAQLPDLTR